MLQDEQDEAPASEAPAPVAAPGAPSDPRTWSWVSHDGLTWWPAYRAADPSQALADGWTNAVDWPNHDQPIVHIQPMGPPPAI